LDAQSATDAARLVDQRDAARLLDAVSRVERLGFPAEHRRQPTDDCVATGWALIDIGLACRDRFRIRPARGVAAFRALRLRQERVDPFSEAAHRVSLADASPRTISPTSPGPR